MELRIVRVTDRFEDGCRFYGELLGWPVTHGWDAPDRGRLFGYGDVARIELIEATGDAVEPVTGVFVSIRHDGLGELYERLLAAGVVIDHPPALQPWGHRSFAVSDPTGLGLVFFEPSEAS
jgi:catechol 2,3-dioxygenase-like lactoylglutathione lyase family enzyme